MRKLLVPLLFALLTASCSGSLQSALGPTPQEELAACKRDGDAAKAKLAESERRVDELQREVARLQGAPPAK